jgi:hypothetical protein
MILLFLLALCFGRRWFGEQERNCSVHIRINSGNESEGKKYDRSRLDRITDQSTFPVEHHENPLQQLQRFTFTRIALIIRLLSWIVSHYLQDKKEEYYPLYENAYCSAYKETSKMEVIGAPLPSIGLEGKDDHTVTYSGFFAVQRAPEIGQKRGSRTVVASIMCTVHALNYLFFFASNPVIEDNPCSWILQF